MTDGTTLLGADDKAGIAIILESMEQLIQSKKEHGFIEVAFTPDEEVGRGVENFELESFQLIMHLQLMGIVLILLIMKHLMQLKPLLHLKVLVFILEMLKPHIRQ